MIFGLTFAAMIAAQGVCEIEAEVDFRAGPKRAAEAGLDVGAFVEAGGERFRVIAARAGGEENPAAPDWSRHGLGVRTPDDRVGEAERRADGDREILAVRLPEGGARSVTLTLGLLYGSGEPFREEAEAVFRLDRGEPLIRRIVGVEAARPMTQADPQVGAGLARALAVAPEGRRILGVVLRPVDGPPDPAFEGEEPEWGPDHAEFVLRALAWGDDCGG